MTCRLSLNELLWGNVSGVTGNLFNGSYTATQQLNAQKTLFRPMLFAPGEQYCYTNSNFNLAAYVVEKVWPGLSKDACLQHRLQARACLCMDASNACCSAARTCEDTKACV